MKGREEILRVHTRGKRLDESVDLHQIARTTPGFTGADLENLINESAILAAKENSRYIRMEDIQRSFIKVGVGTEKKSRLIPEKERKITAYHEAGHAILFHILPDVGPVYTISIIPTGVGAAGYTMPLPENDNVFETKKKMKSFAEAGAGEDSFLILAVSSMASRSSGGRSSGEVFGKRVSNSFKRLV